MPSVYRVFPYREESTASEPGGALYVPPQGAGRIDNPGRFAVLYMSDAAAGAIAEALGRFPEWTQEILEGSPSLIGSYRALAKYRLSDHTRICNLDDPRQLLKLGLLPSVVVTRDYARSRNWANRIYEEGGWAGVRWWSYYDSKWSSFGVWDVRRVALEEVTRLSLDHPALLEAADTIVRRVIGASRT